MLDDDTFAIVFGKSAQMRRRLLGRALMPRRRRFTALTGQHQYNYCDSPCFRASHDGAAIGFDGLAFRCADHGAAMLR